MKFKVLDTIASVLRRHGIEVCINSDSICIGREQWDRFSNHPFMMLSAAPMLIRGGKSFHIFASEQYDSIGNIVKYSVKICDVHKIQLKAWDLDTKHGKHTHPYNSGQKNINHIDYSGSLADIADEIVNIMRWSAPLKLNRI